jgi:hypothetical protein
MSTLPTGVDQDGDSVAPLPVVARSRPTHQVRPQSIVSLRTEEDIQDLAGYMSGFTTLDSPANDTSFDEQHTIDAGPSFSVPPTSNNGRPYISRQDSKSSFAANSESDHHYYSDSDHYFSPFSSSLAGHRQRPPRISTDSVTPSIPSVPSLTSSASCNSVSTNFGVFPSPLPHTPLASSIELSSNGPDYLDIIAELDRNGDDGDTRTTRPSDEFPVRDFNPFEVYSEEHSPLHNWPRHKPDLHWLDTEPLLSQARSKSGGLNSSTAEKFNLSLQAPESESSHSSSTPPSSVSPTPTARSGAGGGSGISRLLGKKKGPEDLVAAEEKRLKKEEAKAKKEELKAKREKLRLEKIQKDVSMYPMRMGGMVALG